MAAARSPGGAFSPDRRSRPLPAAPKSSPQPSRLTSKSSRTGALGSTSTSITGRSPMRRSSDSFHPDASRAGSKRRSLSSSRGVASAGEPQGRRYTSVIGAQEEFSPRLLSLEASASEPSGAPLMPPPLPAGAEPEDRFCTGGPQIDQGTGSRRSSMLATQQLTFPDLISRLESTMGQASLLLSERLRALKNKFNAGASLSKTQESELCEIADGISAASYHIAKWAFLLRPKKDTQAAKPCKPAQNESSEEAFATVHFALPRLMVSATEAQNALAAAVKAHGAGVEARMKLQGIPVEDLRAIVPHLERVLLRLGRLSSAVRIPQNPRTFIPEHFTPAIGSTPAKMLLQYI